MVTSGNVLVPKPGSSLNLFFHFFMEASWHRYDWISCWSLMIHSTSSPSLLLGNQWVPQKVPPLDSWFVPLAINSHFLVLFNCPLISMNPIVVERSLLWITRHSFYLCDTEDLRKEAKYDNKRCSHCSYCSGNSKSFGSCGLRPIHILRSHYWTSYFPVASLLLSYNQEGPQWQPGFGGRMWGVSELVGTGFSVCSTELSFYVFYILVFSEMSCLTKEFHK